MLSFGVLLFTSILLYISIMLLSEEIHSILYKLQQKSSHSFFGTAASFITKLQNPEIKKYSGFGCLLIALWNFFAPDFGSVYNGPTILGALVPVMILTGDAFVLYPDLLNWLPKTSSKDKLIDIIQRFTPLAGVITLCSAIAHMFFHTFPFI
ncbi:MAG: hypothetical protein ACRCTQ_04305 [Brevinemataceae bacterium]